MKTTSTLNISPDLHLKIKVEAAQNGWKIGNYADLIIELGLKSWSEANEKPLERDYLSSRATQE